MTTLYILCALVAAEHPTRPTGEVPDVQRAEPTGRQLDSERSPEAVAGSDDGLRGSPPHAPTANGTRAAGRVALEVAGGALGGLAAVLGGGVAFLAYWAIAPSEAQCFPGDRECDGFTPAFATGFGLMVLSYNLLLPAGVTLAGNALGGQGHYWGALAGMGAGAAVGLSFMMIAVPVESASSEAALALFGAGAVAPIVGAVVGYEWSAGAKSSSSQKVRPTAVPFVSPTRDGRGLSAGLTMQF